MDRMEQPAVTLELEEQDFQKDGEITDNENNPDHNASGFISNKMLSISTTSLKSILPNFYSMAGVSHSTPTLAQEPPYQSASKLTSQSYLNLSELSLDQTAVSDELARESDVIVSTNVTPQAEYKGFASYVVSCTFISLWICWSLLPDRILNKLGVYYYPSRWWALAIPSYVLVSMMYMYIGIACYNVEYLTLPLNDNRTIVDDSGIIVTQLKNFKHSDLEDRYIHSGTSGVWDLPISVVNQVLYSSVESLDSDSY